MKNNCEKANYFTENAFRKFLFSVRNISYKNCNLNGFKNHLSHISSTKGHNSEKLVLSCSNIYHLLNC